MIWVLIVAHKRELRPFPSTASSNPIEQVKATDRRIVRLRAFASRRELRAHQA